MFEVVIYPSQKVIEFTISSILYRHSKVKLPFAICMKCDKFFHKLLLSNFLSLQPCKRNVINEKNRINCKHEYCVVQNQFFFIQPEIKLIS